MEQRRRRPRVNDDLPVAFPAWRVWEDRRVRADNGVMALFASTRIARVSLDERAGGADSALVSELYSDSELPYRTGFRVTAAEARSRWQAGVEGLSQMAIVVALAAMDDLLGATIRLLRATGHDATLAGSIDTGVDAKLRHIRRNAHITIDSDTASLHGLLVAVRHAAIHYGGRQRTVATAWRALSVSTRDWWMTAACGVSSQPALRGQFSTGAAGSILNRRCGVNSQPAV
jgi:hypothetical protein